MLTAFGVERSLSSITRSASLAAAPAPRPPLRRVGDACLAQPAWLPRESQAAARTPESTELGTLLPPQRDGLCVSVESAFVVHVCGAQDSPRPGTTDLA